MPFQNLFSLSNFEYCLIAIIVSVFTILGIRMMWRDPVDCTHIECNNLKVKQKITKKMNLKQSQQMKKTENEKRNHFWFWLHQKKYNVRAVQKKMQNQYEVQTLLTYYFCCFFSSKCFHLAYVRLLLCYLCIHILCIVIIIYDQLRLFASTHLHTCMTWYTSKKRINNTMQSIWMKEK